MYTLSRQRRRVTPPAAAIAAPANPPTTTNKTITDTKSGETMTVTNDGNCASVSVKEAATSGFGFADVGVTHALSYGLDGTCHVVILSSATSATTKTADGAASESSSAHGGVGPTSSGNSMAVPATDCTTWGNVVHGSQTLQDVVNIDIGKYRYGHDRNWNACWNQSIFYNWWMVDSTSTSWNHPNAPVIDSFDSTWHTYAANGYGHGSFHSDFLWCNFQPGQNYNM
jgi:hypothetical protein